MFAHRRISACLRALACVAAACATALATAAPGGAASSDVVVEFDVLSSTTLDASACDSGPTSNGVLALGAVLPGSKQLSTPCAVTFGSSNDTSSLRISQQDGTGSAMWAYGDGTIGGWGFGGYIGYTGATDSVYQTLSVQRDGKIVAVGYTDGQASILISRYLPNGSPDTTFDGDSGTADGHVVIAPPEPGVTLPWEVIVDDEGRILVLMDRATGAPLGPGKFQVLRLLPDGKLDTSWGGDGMVVVDPTGLPEQPRDMALQDDGKIIIAGCAIDSGNCGSDSRMVLARITTSGVLDTSFGAGGVVVETFGAGPEFYDAVEVDELGRVVVAGNSVGVGGGYVVRFTVNGALDTAGFNPPFGYVGVTVGTGTTDLRALAIQPDGRILVAGAEFGGADNWAAARLLDDGSFDTNFGGDGTVVIDMLQGSDGRAYEIGQLGDGRFILAGQSGSGLLGLDWMSAMLHADGTLDTTWAGDGRDRQSLIGGLNSEYANDVAFGRDGQILLAGMTTDGGGDLDALVMAYDAGDPVADYQDGVADWDTMPATSAFGVCLDSVASGAAPSWTASAGCPQGDGAWWRGVPAAASTVATAPSATTNAVATLRFGSRAADDLAPSSYVARIAFDVVAPAV